MANSPQAKKRVRRNAHRTEINSARMSRIRTFEKKVNEAISLGDTKSASEALRLAQPEIARGVTKGVLHKNTAARKISRLNKRIKNLS